jgi:hypothetical protein
MWFHLWKTTMGLVAALPSDVNAEESKDQVWDMYYEIELILIAL